jgi:hypothetical protein
MAELLTPLQSWNYLYIFHDGSAFGSCPNDQDEIRAGNGEFIIIELDSLRICKGLGNWIPVDDNAIIDKFQGVIENDKI